MNVCEYWRSKMTPSICWLMPRISTRALSLLCSAFGKFYCRGIEARASSNSGAFGAGMCKHSVGSSWCYVAVEAFEQDGGRDHL